MAGRGFSLKDLKKKDDEKSEANASVASSFTPFAGRGLGRGFQLPPSKPAPAENASVVSSTSGIGRGLNTVGRGLFAMKTKTTVSTLSSEGKSSDPVESTLGSAEKKENSASSGIIAGRGFTSGRGTATGSGRGSSGMTQPRVAESSFESPVTAVEPPVVVTQPVPSPPDDVPPEKKYNTKSKEIGAMVNLIELHCEKACGIFEYQVDFLPTVDNMKFRAKYMRDHIEVLGSAKTFDGVILFLPHRLPNEITKLVSKNAVEGEQDIEIRIIYKRQKSRVECVQLYNILFERIFRVLNFLRVGRKSFDPTAPHLIPQHKLEIWPGYVKAVDIHEKDRLLLTLDVSHRVLSTRTVLDVIKDAMKSDRDRFKDNIQKALIGSIVLTRYNNKTYRIDDICFDKSPQTTFEKNGSEISFMDYYKTQHGINVQDQKQFLLVSRMEVRISGEKEKKEYMVMLIPELCSMTGLSDQEKSNFTVMKDLSSYTKMSPLQRVNSFKTFLSNVNGNEKTKGILAEWGLSLDMEPLHLKARLLDEEKIFFGRNKEAPAGPQADFSRAATSNQVLEPIDIVHWMLFYVKSNKKEAESLESNMLKICGPTGMRVAAARHFELANDRTETYITTIRKELVPEIQIVVCIFPSLRDDRYSAVKKILCAELPVPSQCVNSKTLRNEAKNRSIVMKILLQMNCKLGGTLWGIKIPLKDTMICGIDTYHETGHKGITVGGLVASLNPQFTKWWSRPTIQDKREELVNGLTGLMEAALRYYKKTNDSLPDRIILYRDGVGDGQLNVVKKFEIPQFEAAFENIDKDYKPKLTFVVVQKRINVKFFMETGMKDKDALKNPPPGSVLDHTVTSRELYDFYLVSQHVREGTTTPSHYIVLKDDSDFEPSILQRITYKLTYLYYNWPGTVRVPAPCQYAHKLADLVGNSIKKQVAEKLNDKLFYL